MRLVLLGGLSGSGKSVALNMLEDLGYHTVDNLPLTLIGPTVEATLGADRMRYPRLAIGVDSKSTPTEFEELARHITQWREAAHGCTVVYLLTDEATLIKRYSETRRRHPLADGRDLPAAIAAEREVLEPLAQLADERIDTTRTNVHELRELVRERVAPEAGRPMTLVVESFAYRSGVPQDADLVFDVRCLPNPYWEPGLRGMTGQDQPIAAYLERHNVVNRMLVDLRRFLEAWVPAYSGSNRSYLTVAIGCTGGRHRSVFVAEHLSGALSRNGWRVLLKHWELGTPPREVVPAPVVE